MIIFLDFDGVLHPEIDEPYEFFCCLPLFWEILDRIPHARVVFSTSWRRTHARADLIGKVLSNRSGEMHRFIGETPDLEDSTREAECIAWINENNYSGPWIALDDVGEWFPNSQNLCLVDSRTGLTKLDVDRVCHLAARLEKLAQDEQRRLAFAPIIELLNNPETATEILASGRAEVERWKAKRLCSSCYIDAWEKLLDSATETANTLMDESKTHLQQNHPFVVCMRRLGHGY